jgi:putative spermidine/putrescine transport system permease protein
MKTGGERLAMRAAGLLLGVVLVILYAPVAIVVLGAFFLDDAGNFDFTAPTLSRFTTFLDNPQVVDALLNTIAVGIGAVILSVLMALLLATYVHARPRWSNGILQFLIFLPFLLPPLIVGLSLLIFFRGAGIPSGIIAVSIGHALFVLALVYRGILNRLTQMGHSLIEASLDLGATPGQTFFRILLPQLMGSIVLGAVLAFALSFDETLISLFLVGDQNTLPIKLWAMMRVGFSPEINALATIILAASLLMIWLATRRTQST